jgi:hypothetical protein
LGFLKIRIFLRKGLDRPFSDLPVGQSMTLRYLPVRYEENYMIAPGFRYRAYLKELAPVISDPRTDDLRAQIYD